MAFATEANLTEGQSSFSAAKGRKRRTGRSALQIKEAGFGDSCLLMRPEKSMYFAQYRKYILWDLY